MQFRKDVLDQIVAGQVTLAFRRWRKPTVVAGGNLLTAVGVLAIDKVEKVNPRAVTDRDAKLAGLASRADLMAEIERAPVGDLYRVGLRWTGSDPRILLRKDAKLTKADMKSAIAALGRLDKASEGGAWTAKILRLIDKYPARRAPDLAASVGRDPMTFKRDVRKLNELGLTENLEVGYRLSPRGRAIIAEIVAQSPH